MQEQKIAVIIPTYNEAANLTHLIPALYKQIPKANIIVVDDNSKDNTRGLIGKLKSKYVNLTLLERARKEGRGTAVMHGFKHAINKTNADYFVEMDADFSHDPKEITKILSKASENSVVVGSRYIKGGSVINIPLKRKILSRTANECINFLLSLPAKDNTNGYRLYSKKAISVMLNHKYISRGFVCIPESAYILTKKGFKIEEVPITFVNRTRGGSKVTIHEIFTWIRDLIKIRLSS